MSIAVGINAPAAVYFGTARPFKDLVRTCDDWTVGASKTDPGSLGFTWRPDGYPAGLDATQSIAAGFGALRLPAGDYKVRIRGKGHVQLTFFLGSDYQTITDSRFPEWTTAGGTTDGTFNLPLPVVGSPTLAILASDPADPIRGIEVLEPGFDPGDADIWHPEFIADLAPFSCVRPMDQLAPINSPLVAWADRTDDSFFTGSGRQIPLAWLPSLARQLAAAKGTPAELWLCGPYLGTADYWQQFGAWCFAQLPAGTKVVVEYGNENWNEMFGTQSAYFKAQGATLHPEWSADSSRQGRAAAGKLAKVAHDNFLIGWGSAGRSRLTLVLGAQPGGGGDELAEYVTAQGGSTPTLTVAPYIDASAFDNAAGLGYPHHDTTYVLGLGTAGLLARMGAGGEYLNDIVASLAGSAAIAAAHGCPPIRSYEGGLSTLGAFAAQTNVALNALYDAANRDQGVYQVVLDWLAAIGPHVAEVNFYHACGALSLFGRWGAREYQGQALSAAPKRRALADYLAGSPQSPPPGDPGVPTAFKQHRDNATTTVASSRSAGGTTLAVATGSGAKFATGPGRIVCVQAAGWNGTIGAISDPTKRTILTYASRTGDTFAGVAVQSGFTDLDLAANDVVLDAPTWEDFIDLHTAVNAVEATITGGLEQIAGLADPNADRLLFWDDSAGSYAFLAAGSGLTIAGTTISAAGGGGGSLPDGTASGQALTWDGSAWAGGNAIGGINLDSTFGGGLLAIYHNGDLGIGSVAGNAISFNFSGGHTHVLDVTNSGLAVSFDNGTSTAWSVTSAGVAVGPGGPLTLRADGSIALAALADSAAPNSSLYLSTTNGKPSWKSAAGVVTPLY